MDKEDIEDFEEGDKLEVAKKNKKGVKDGGDAISIESSNVSEGSASATLLSSHAMRMGLYTINLGTKMGQKLHTGHMLFLPLIPVFILLGQNIASYMNYTYNAAEIMNVKTQVDPFSTYFYNFVFIFSLGIKFIRRCNDKFIISRLLKPLIWHCSWKNCKMKEQPWR